MNEKQRARAAFIPAEIAASELDHPGWRIAEPIAVDTYWSGAKAPSGRHFEARMLWTDEHLCVRFDANQDEPLVMSVEPARDTKSLGLWDRDVVEIFIAPERGEPRRYYEFEAAPNGEWVDLAIDLTSGERATDTLFRSGMETAARIREGAVTTTIKVPWAAFGKRPAAGDIWLGNLLRCVGRDPERGYLAWSPTLSPVPNFHVPERFGEFEFVG